MEESIAILRDIYSALLTLSSACRMQHAEIVVTASCLVAHCKPPVVRDARVALFARPPHAPYDERASADKCKQHGSRPHQENY